MEAQNTKHIYALIDPITNTPKYIGSTKNIKHRMRLHLGGEHKMPEKYLWIKELSEKGLKPTGEIIDTVPASEGCFWEGYYISLYRSWGFSLLNKQFITPFTESHRNNIRVALQGRTIPEEVRRKIGIKSSATPRTETWKNRIAHTHRTGVSNCRQINQYHLNGDLIKTWRSAVDIKKELALNENMIGYVCKGKFSFHYKGFIWKYKE